jgi:hypothetical protein
MSSGEQAEKGFIPSEAGRFYSNSQNGAPIFVHCDSIIINDKK